MALVTAGILQPEKLLEWYFDVDPETAKGLRPKDEPAKEVPA